MDSDKAFYAQERQRWTGVWNISISVDQAAELANRLLDACGEREVVVVAVVDGGRHEATDDEIKFLACQVTTHDVVHETAHVIHWRNAGEHEEHHSAEFWNLMELLDLILEEIM